MRIKVMEYARDIYDKELRDGFGGARTDDAGIDLRACESVSFRAGDTLAVPLGVEIALPDHTVGWLTGRSGVAMRGLMLHDGTIDQGFRGQLHAITHALRDGHVTLGERIAQLVVLLVRLPNDWHMSWVVVDELEPTNRGKAGFGSTGRI